MFICKADLCSAYTIPGFLEVGSLGALSQVLLWKRNFPKKMSVVRGREEKVDS